MIGAIDFDEVQMLIVSGLEGIEAGFSVKKRISFDLNLSENWARLGIHNKAG